MRFPTILAAAAAAVAFPACADSYRTGLGTIAHEVTVGPGGAVLVTGSAVAEIAEGGAVTAEVTVGGEACATSTRDGVSGIAMAKASCLVTGEPGSVLEVKLVERNERGDSKRSTLRTRDVADPAATGTVLGEASGNGALGIAIRSDRDLALVVEGRAGVEFAACVDCPLGTGAGMGSFEMTYRLGDEWAVCSQTAFNRFGGLPEAASCAITAPAGVPLYVAMSVPVAGGARVTDARLTVRAAE